MSLPRSTNAFFSPKRSFGQRFWNEWFACRFDRFRRNPRGPNGRTHTASFATKRGENQQAHPRESAQRNPCGPDSGPCFDRCCNKGQSSAITGPLAGWTRSRACPSHGTPVIVFRVFRDDFCNVRFVSRVWMDLTERVFLLSFLDGFSIERLFVIGC